MRLVRGCVFDARVTCNALSASQDTRNPAVPNDGETRDFFPAVAEEQRVIHQELQLPREIIIEDVSDAATVAGWAERP